MVTRKEIFDQAAQKLRQDFEELSVVPHNALKGGQAEKLVKTFLKGHLPKRFGVEAGFIIDKRDSVSQQTDVIIYDAINCPVYRVSSEAGIFPSDNVAAVVEVKSRLDKEQLYDAWDKISAIKRLGKTKAPGVPFLVLTQTLGCVFAFDSISLETLASHYVDLLRRDGIGTHIDLIAILDRGLITLVGQMPGADGWGLLFWVSLPDVPEGEGAHVGVGAQELGKGTLDAFLRCLLPHLAHFRGIVDHPGFDWKSGGNQGLMQVTYVTSITQEKDPDRKKEKLRAYEEAIRNEFDKNAKEPAGDQKKRPD